MPLDWILLLFQLFVFLFVISAFFLPSLKNHFLNDAPFVPTRKAALSFILQKIVLSPGSVFYDLGCGDGRILSAFATQYPDSKCIGIERSLGWYFFARLRVRAKNSKIYRGDYLKADFSSATHIYAYLFPEALEKLYPKFLRELKPGSKVFSLDFQIKERKADKIHEIPASNSRSLGKVLYEYTF